MVKKQDFLGWDTITKLTTLLFFYLVTKKGSDPKIGFWEMGYLLLHFHLMLAMDYPITQHHLCSSLSIEMGIIREAGGGRFYTVF